MYGIESSNQGWQVLQRFSINLGLTVTERDPAANGSFDGIVGKGDVLRDATVSLLLESTVPVALQASTGDSTPLTLGQAREFEVTAYADARKEKLARGAAIGVCSSLDDAILSPASARTDGTGKVAIKVTAGPKARVAGCLQVTACSPQTECKVGDSNCSSLVWLVRPQIAVVERVSLAFGSAEPKVGETLEILANAFTSGAFDEKAAFAPLSISGPEGESVPS